MSDTVLRCHYDALQSENRDLCKKVEDQTFFLKAAQAESEKYCEQRDYLLRVLQHITCEPINAEYMAQEAIDAICADEINEANGGAVCRVTANQAAKRAPKPSA
jgi:hypothetical protein